MGRLCKEGRDFSVFHSLTKSELNNEQQLWGWLGNMVWELSESNRCWVSEWVQVTRRNSNGGRGVTATRPPWPARRTERKGNWLSVRPESLWCCYYSNYVVVLCTSTPITLAPSPGSRLAPLPPHNTNPWFCLAVLYVLLAAEASTCLWQRHIVGKSPYLSLSLPLSY